MIGDSKVAEIYEHYLGLLKVDISRQKSLISTIGALEFAKRFRIRGASVDISPIEIRTLSAYTHPYGVMAICNKYPVKRFSTAARIAGFGYRAIAKRKKPSPRLIRLETMLNKPKSSASYPFEWWLGRGRPLSPYLRGSLIFWLQQEMKPKELKVAPDEL